MMKERCLSVSLITILLLTISVITVLSVSSPNFVLSQATGTQVGGILWDNTTWTKANSPYVITSTVQIPSNVTLTIEPGVVVNSALNPGEDMFLLQGRILAIGNPENRIIFDGNNASFFNSEPPTGESYATLDYCIFRNGKQFWNGKAFFNLTHSEFINIENRISLFAGICHIKYNIFVDSPQFYINLGGAYIEYNLFYGKSPSLGESGALILSMWTTSEQVQVHYNSFIDIEGIVLELAPEFSEMNATHNYWGTTNTSLIDSKIYDRADDIRCSSFIDYLPVLTVPHPDTPPLSALPTPTPTSTPSPSPTPTQTSSHTTEPSANPTAEPTSTPTTAPTNEPTSNLEPTPSIPEFPALLTVICVIMACSISLLRLKKERH